MRDNIEFTDPELSSESTLSRILIGRICRLGLPKGLCHYNTTKSEILEPAVSPGRFIFPAAMYGSPLPLRAAADLPSTREKCHNISQ